MSLELEAITVNGAALDLGDVLADVTIRHGRTGFFDAASASTCQITLLGVDRALTSPFRLGALLVVSSADPVAAPVNGDFSDGLDGWDTSWGESTARVVGGAAEVTRHGETWADGIFHREWAPTGAGAFAFGARVKVPAGLWVYVQASQYDAAHNAVGGYVGFDVEGDGGWQAVSESFTLDPACAFLDVGVYFYPTSPADNDAGDHIATGGPPGTMILVDDVFAAPAGARFTGRFTDATLVDDVLTAIAVGALRTLPGYELIAAYPQEKWSARVTRAFTEAGIAGTLALELGPFDPLLVAEPAPTSTRTLGGYLDELAAMVGAAVADLPDGRILVQAIDSRTIGGAVALDPAEVGYAPEWSLRLPGANIVDVTYGEPASSVSARDPASVALYGPIAASVATRFLNAVDAQAVANGRIASGAYSRWTVGDAPLLVGLALKIGTPVTLSLLPPAAPHASWTPLLEGWTDRIVSDGERLEWTMELALSDPLLSGLTLPWNAVPTTPAYQWNTINQSTAWRDALSLDALDPA